MEPFSFSTSHFSIPTNTTLPPFSSSALFAAKHHHPSATSFSLRPAPDSDNSSSAASGNFRRPWKPLKTTTPSSNPKPLLNSNPLKNKNPFSSPRSLTNKLWLTSKLSPPPPPPPPPPLTSLPTEDVDEVEQESSESRNSADSPAAVTTHFREPGKVFVGNLPGWVKKHEVGEFFRQFGPIRSVILIKGHNDTQRNAGFGFVIYGGEAETAENSAMKAVEFDGVEFHGRVLTVKLDDGRRVRDKTQERARWLEGSDGNEDYRSEWHEDRDGARKEFRKVLETVPENWQAVIRAFERIKKVAILIICIMLYIYCFFDGN